MDLTLITQLWEQVIASKIWLVIAIILNIVVFLWRLSETANNRWIPHILVLGGMLLYWLLGPMDTIPKEQRHPEVLMLLFGAILGFISWAANGAVAKAISAKFPGLFPEPDAKQQNKLDKQNERHDPESKP